MTLQKMVSDLGNLMGGTHQQEDPTPRLLACLVRRAPPRRRCPSAALATSPPPEPMMAIFPPRHQATEHGTQSPLLSQLAPSTAATTITASSPKRVVTETGEAALPVQDSATAISRPARFCLSRRNGRPSRDALEWSSLESLDPNVHRTGSAIIHVGNSDEEDEDDGEYFGLPSEYVEVCTLGRGGYGTVL